MFDNHEVSADQILASDRAAFADLYDAPDPPPDTDRLIVLGGEGCPALPESCIREFGDRLNMSHADAAALLGDALALRHRFPKTWARVLAGAIPARQARALARACVSLPLPVAAFVDEEFHSILGDVDLQELNMIIGNPAWKPHPSKRGGNAGPSLQGSVGGRRHIGPVFKYRLVPTPAQETALLDHCGHARFVWNLGLEQRLMWRPRRSPAPGYVTQAAQLTEARAAEPWLAAGSQTVQQQALRDLDQAWRDYSGGTHPRPTWRKAGQHEGFRIAGPLAQRVERMNRKWGRVLVPKVGWIKFRWSRQVPDANSYRITRASVELWHIAFAAIPDLIPAPGNG